MLRWPLLCLLCKSARVAYSIDGRLDSMKQMEQPGQGATEYSWRAGTDPWPTAEVLKASMRKMVQNGMLSVGGEAQRTPTGAGAERIINAFMSEALKALYKA